MRRRFPGEAWPEFRYEGPRRVDLLLRKIRDNGIRLMGPSRPGDAARIALQAQGGSDVVAQIDDEISRLLEDQPIPREIAKKTEQVLAGVESVAWELDRLKGIIVLRRMAPADLEEHVAAAAFEATPEQIEAVIYALLETRARPLGKETLGFLADSPKLEGLIGFVPGPWILLKILLLLWIVWLIQLLLSRLATESIDRRVDEPADSSGASDSGPPTESFIPLIGRLATILKWIDELLETPGDSSTPNGGMSSSSTESSSSSSSSSADSDKCTVKLKLSQKRLCLGAKGSAEATTDPDGTITWIVGSELRILSGQGTKKLQYQAIAPGCPKITVILSTGKAKCAASGRLAIPDAGIALATPQRVRGVSVMGQPPAIILRSPAASGADDELRPLSQISGDSPGFIEGSFTLAGRVADPLGVEGLTLSWRAISGDVTPANGDVELDATGEFLFEATLKGMTHHTLEISVTGHSGATGIAILTGQVRSPESYWTLLESIDSRMRAVEEQWLDRAQEYLTSGTAFHEEALNNLQKELSDALEPIRSDGETQKREAMRQFGAFWTAGESAPLPAILPNSARYRMEADDCSKPGIESGSVDGRPVSLEGPGGQLVSVQPEAFCVIPAEGFIPSPDYHPPGLDRDVVIEMRNWIEQQASLGASYATCPFQIPLIQVLVSGDEYALLATVRDPDTNEPIIVRNIEHELEARVVGDGARDLQQIAWSVVYGPRLGALEISPFGPQQSKARVRAFRPGVYVVAARAITDHDNPFALGLFRITALEMDLHLVSSSLGNEDPSNENESVPRLSLDDLYIDAGVNLTYSLEAGRPATGWGRVFQLETRWRGYDANGPRRAEGPLSLRYALGRDPRKEVRIEVSLVELRHVVSGKRVDLSPLALTASVERILLKPGLAHTVEARLVYPGRPPDLDWVELAEFPSSERDFYNDPEVVAAANSWGAFPMDWSRFNTDSPDRIQYMGITIRVKDQFGNLAPPGTPIAAELFGDGALGFGEGAGSRYEAEINENGTAAFRYQAGEGTDQPADATPTPAPPLKTLIKFNIGPKVYYLGDVLAATEFEIRPIAGESDSANGAIHGVQSSDTFAAEVQATIRSGGERIPLPPGTEIHARISDGSVRDKGGKRMPNGVLEVGYNGSSRLEISRVCYSSDGERHILRSNAWGVATLQLSVGASVETTRVDFDKARSMGACPLLEFFGMPFVGQADFLFVPRPADQPGGPLLPIEAESRMLLHGEAGKTGLFEIRQRLQARLIVRFTLTGQGFTGINPGFDNSAPPDPRFSYATRLETRNEGPIPDFYVGHTSLDTRQPPPLSTDAASLNVGRGPLGAAIGAALGVYYGAPLPGSAGFEVSILLRGGRQCICECLKIVGSGANGLPLESRGFLKISFVDDDEVRSHIRVEFEAQGCQGLPRSTMRRVVRSADPDLWGAVKVRVEPDMVENKTVIRITFGRGPSAQEVVREINQFNFLPGATYHMSIGRADRGQCWLADFNYSYLQSDTINFRRDDGMETAWLVHRFSGTAPHRVTLFRQAPQEAYDFRGEHVARWGKFSRAYCEHFSGRETSDIAALSPEALRVFNYTSDFFSGVLVGESRTATGFAGDFAAGMLGWGDLRDIIKNLAYAVPGGQKPDWKVFWLSVLGLGLDIAQFFTAGVGAAPNAVVAILKQLMINLRRFATPETMRVARILGYYARKLLVELHGIKIGRAVQVGATVYELRGLKALLGPEFIDFFFEGLENRLEEIVGHFRAIPYPGPPNFNINTAVVAAAASVPAITDAIRTVSTRIEIISAFFNPKILSAPHLQELCFFFAILRKQPNVRDEKLLRLLKAAYDPDVASSSSRLVWNLHLSGAKQQDRAGLILAHAIGILSRYMTELADAKVSPSALRGLLAFAAASGPHRAVMMIHNFCPDGRITKEFIEVMQDCDHARRLVQNMELLDVFGRPRAVEANERLRILHDLWSSLAARSPRREPLTGNVNGAIAELKALRRFGDRIKYVAPLGMFPSGRTFKLQDFLLEATHGIEVKSVMSGRNLPSRVESMKRQLERWVAQNYQRHIQNLAHAQDLARPIVGRMTYVLVIPRGSRRRGPYIERELRRFASLLEEINSDVPGIVPKLDFELIYR